MSFSSPCRAATPPDCEIHNDTYNDVEPILSSFPSVLFFPSSQTSPFKKRRLQRKRDLSSSSFSDPPPPPPKLRRLVASYWSSSTTTNGAHAKSHIPIGTQQLARTNAPVKMSMTHGSSSTKPNWLEITRGPPTSGSCYYEGQDTIDSTTAACHPSPPYAPRSIFSTIQRSRNIQYSSSSSSSSSSYGSSEKNDGDDNEEEDSLAQFPISFQQQYEEEQLCCHPFPNKAAHDDMEEEELVLLVSEMKHASAIAGEDASTAHVITRMTTHSDPYHRGVDSTCNNVTPSPNMMLQEQQQNLSSISSGDTFYHDPHHTTSRKTESPLPAPLPLWEPTKTARENQKMEPATTRMHHPHVERTSRSYQMDHRHNTIHDHAFSKQAHESMSSISDEDHHSNGSFAWNPPSQGGIGGSGWDQHRSRLRILPPPLDSSSISQMTMKARIPSPRLSSSSRTGDEYSFGATDCVSWSQHHHYTPVVPPNSPMRFNEAEEEQRKQHLRTEKDAFLMK